MALEKVESLGNDILDNQRKELAIEINNLLESHKNKRKKL